MRKIRGSAFVSLDGVMQAPGGPSEDWTGGFDYGGWVWPFFDETGGKAIDDFFGDEYDLLLGRKTYEIFAAYWPYATGDNAPMGEAFTRANKYVLTGGADALPWENSHRLADIDALTALKKGDGPDMLIQGSTTLYPQLLADGLIDELTVMTFPVILGSGKRLFGDGTPPGGMKLISHKISGTGVVIATYKPDGPVATGSFAAQEPSEREQARQLRMKEDEI